jgi:hypothetical protein
LFGSSPGGPGLVRPEHAQAQGADLQALARAHRDDGHVIRLRGGDGGIVILALGGDPWIEHRTDLDRLEHAGRAADVVALRMGEDERDEPLDAEVLELAGDVSLRRPLVDQNGALPDLQQDRVSLADVERGDPKAFRDRRRVARDAPPRNHGQDEPTGHKSRPPSPAAGRANEQREEERGADQGQHGRTRLDLRVRKATD